MGIQSSDNLAVVKPNSGLPRYELTTKRTFNVSLEFINEALLPPKKDTSLRDSEQGKKIFKKIQTMMSEMPRYTRIKISGDDVSRELVASYVQNFYVYNGSRLKQFSVIKEGSKSFFIWRVV